MFWSTEALKRWSVAELKHQSIESLRQRIENAEKLKILQHWFIKRIELLKVLALKRFEALQHGHIEVFKGSRQWESRGVRNVSNCPNLARTPAIEVRFSLNFAVVFDFIYFRFRPSKAKWIGNGIPNRRNAAIRSMFFFLLYNALCLLTHRIILRH